MWSKTSRRLWILGFALGSVGACGGRGNLKGDEVVDGGSESGSAGLLSGTSGSRVMPASAGSGMAAGGAATAGASASGGAPVGGVGVGGDEPARGGRAPLECVPGRANCGAGLQDQSLLRCTADGTFVMERDCTQQKQRCSDGACRDRVCEPSQLFCEGNAVRICDANGGGSRVWDECGKNQHCDEQKLICTAGFCEPKQPACDGTRATTCNRDGSAYSDAGTDCVATSHLQCKQGTCECAPDFEECDGDRSNGCEANLISDVANCGSCFRVCSDNHVPLPSCNGDCDGVCEEGFWDCNGLKTFDGCEIDGRSDPGNCGGCGLVCSGNNVSVASCGDGECNGACLEHFNDCNSDKQSDGCESDSRTDARNCGGCGLVCAREHVKPECNDGVCNGECASGYDDCDGNKQTNGCEVNTQEDVDHCGGCGNACGQGEQCLHGKCAAAKI